MHTARKRTALPSYAGRHREVEQTPLERWARKFQKNWKPHGAKPPGEMGAFEWIGHEWIAGPDLVGQAAAHDATTAAPDATTETEFAVMIPRRSPLSEHPPPTTLPILDPQSLKPHTPNQTAGPESFC